MTEVPSSEFTFSVHSQSEVAFTPSSSRDTNRSEGPALTPQTPRLVPIFGNLGLNDSLAPMHSPPTWSSNAWLRPGSSHSNYAQQHNASPSPSPRPELVRTINGSQQHEKTSSISSSSTRATPRIPGAFPTSSTGQAAPPTESDRVQDDEESDSDHCSDVEEMTEAKSAGVREEPLPTAPIYSRRVQDGLKEVKCELAALADIMGLSELNQDHSSDLHVLYKRTKKMSMFEYPETRTVGFIGDSGVGKSSLINSLLDQESLSRSSREGTACTCVVTEFRHVDENHTGPFTIEADFMTSEEMKGLLGELLTIFRQFHVTRFFQELKSQEEQQKCRDQAGRAWGTFQSLFNKQPGLTMEHLSQDFEDAYLVLLSQLERWASASLALRPGGLDALEYSVVAGDIEECRDILDMLTASNAGNGNPAIWPFIKLIRVYLKSPILRNGLVLADLPGFSDLNFARVRATERYLSHSCDEVFVVMDISRACTNASVQDIMRRCRDDQPRRIICTKSEDISPEESSRGDTPYAHRVKEMNKEMQVLRKKLESTESKARKASPARRSELAVKAMELRGQEKVLKFNMSQFLINRRNSLISHELIQRHQDVEVFCVSNILYSEYRFSGKSDEEAYVDLAGIRELRRYCQLVPAAALMRSTSAFLNHEVPALLSSLRQWALSGVDPVTGGNAALLRRVLENAQNSFHRELISDQGLAQITRRSLIGLYDECITNIIRQYQSRWTAESIQISLEWAGWSHSTYSAFCSHYGDHTTGAVPNGRCWNDDLLQPSREQLTLKWENIQTSLHLQEGSLARYTDTIFDKWCLQFGAHIQLAPCALANLQQSMKFRQQCIGHHISNTLLKVIQCAGKIKRDTIYGHASSYITGLMQPAYAKINQEGGTGSDKRRKKIMNDHLTHSMLFANISRLAGREYIGALDACFDDLQTKLTEEVESMARDFNAVIADEGQLSEAEKAPAVANALESRFEKTKDILERAQIIVRELNPDN
ncbi:hypothetical protein CBS147311_9154 [Penicillium roqueforti]|nr:hypothetical protein CBS147311_9154 [Penicillium roqueforti]